MHVLVINSGSSSIKFSVFAVEAGDPQVLLDGEVAGIGTSSTRVRLHDASGNDLSSKFQQASASATTSAEAMKMILPVITSTDLPVDAVGYRIVHPGPNLDRHQKITPAVLQELEAAAAFAPLHDPVAVGVIHQTMASLPRVNHYACFDTIFHQTMPETAKTYPISVAYRAQGVRRYGFHGLSCESIVHQLSTDPKRQDAKLPPRMIIAHLGSGCSVTAVLDGASIDTTMGLTPTGGVVMGTRPGDLDPGLILYLLRQMHGDDKVSALEYLLNHNAGTAELSGLPNDMKALREAAGKGDARAKLAIDIFTRSVKKAIGGFIALMGGVDTMIFAGGIGEHDAAAREEIVSGLEAMGIRIDPERNKDTSSKDAIRTVSAADSSAAVFVVPAEEDWMIASHVYTMSLSESDRSVA